MDLFERRRGLLSGKGLLPLIVWQNGMTSVSEIPVSYTEKRCTLTYFANATRTYVYLKGQSGPQEPSVSFTIPAKYIKKAKRAYITWYVASAYMSCHVKIMCGEHTLQDTGEENYQTRVFNCDISSFDADMTITFIGDRVGIYNLVIA